MCGCSQVPSTIPHLSTSTPSQSAAYLKSRGSTYATIVFPVPADSTGSKVGYVSPATSHIKVTANGKVALDTTVSGSGFAREFGTPSGSVAFRITLSDYSGRPLSEERVIVSVPAGKATAIPVQFKGVPAKAMPATTMPSPPVGHAATIPVTFTVDDIDNNAIYVGAFAQPVRLQLVGGGGHMKLQSSLLAAPTQTIKVNYDGRPMTEFAVLQPGSATGSSGLQKLSLIGNAYSLFPLPQTGYGIPALTAGPNHTMLFAQCNGSCIVSSIDQNGTITNIGTVPHVYRLLYGTDHNIWISEGDEYSPGGIDRMTSAGKVSHFNYSAGTYALALAPNGDIWFGQGGGLGRITTTGHITSYKVPYGGFPDRSDSIVIANGWIYSDEPPDAVCVMTLSATHARCIGNDMALGSQYGGPLVWHKNEVLFLDNSDSPATLAAAGTNLRVRKVQTLHKMPLVPPQVDDRGTLLGFGQTQGSFSSNPAGLTVETLGAGGLSETTYPAPMRTTFPSSVYIALDDLGGVWLASGDVIVKFLGTP